MTPDEKKFFAAHMGDCIFAAFRQASVHRSAGRISALIQDLPEEDWRAIVNFAAAGLIEEIEHWAPFHETALAIPVTQGLIAGSGQRA